LVFGLMALDGHSDLIANISIAHTVGYAQFAIEFSNFFLQLFWSKIFQTTNQRMFHIPIVYDYNCKVNEFWLSECGTVVADAEPFAVDVL